MLELKFQLKDGRQIFLESFWQTKTYAGLLEGTPSEAVNRRVLDSIAEIPKRIWPREPCVTLGLEAYKKRVEEPFPVIVCAGQFISYEPVANTKRAGSALVVIWFQSEMFPLLEGQNAAWLKDVVWNDLARDFDW